jgi:CBS domain-containing protein
MGEQNVKQITEGANHQEFMLETLDDDRFTHELGLFNLEANLSPQTFGGDCLRLMESELQEVYQRAQKAAKQLDCDIALVGILPTLTMENLGLDSMVPTPRYHALNDAIRALRGEEFQFTINGIDQLSIRHDNVMLEACNTSFQVHFQVSPEDFTRFYNIAQAVTGPLLAAAVNSPILLGKRLWHETRIAVFENSVDTRSEAQQERGLKPRVHFGDRWLEESATEIFKEDIARFRIVLTTETEDDPLGMIEQGIMPSLNALRLHNGTVYRWNRPCYGVHNNIPHLRIENRVIPSGPTVVDEMANAAFFFGMMAGMAAQVKDIRDHLSFADVKANFLGAARDGIRAQMCWFDDTHMPAKELVLEQLLPLAREGLQEAGINQDDIDRYLGVLHDRVTSRRTGARWALESLEKMEDSGTLNQRMRCLVSSMVDQQSSGKPICEWVLAEYCAEHVDFAATLMDWRHVRHVPVEDDRGFLVGLVSHRALLRLVATGRAGAEHKVSVKEIMNTQPITVQPDTSTADAIRMMREQKLACLPVTRDGKLVGIVTEHDLIVVASRLLETYLANEE